MLRAFVPLHLDQALVRNALTSIERIALGFTLAVMMAVPLGVYMATFPPIAAFFRPVTLVGSYVPTVVFIPLSIAWFGATEIQKIAFLFIVYFVALLPLVIKTVADVPAAYLDVAVTKGASQWQLVRHVLFPVAKADIWDHLRGAYGVGWTWIILAEVWANAENGWVIFWKSLIAAGGWTGILPSWWLLWLLRSLSINSGESAAACCFLTDTSPRNERIVSALRARHGSTGHCFGPDESLRGVDRTGAI